MTHSSGCPGVVPSAGTRAERSKMPSPRICSTTGNTVGALRTVYENWLRPGRVACLPSVHIAAIGARLRNRATQQRSQRAAGNQHCEAEKRCEAGQTCRPRARGPCARPFPMPGQARVQDIHVRCREKPVRPFGRRFAKSAIRCVVRFRCQGRQSARRVGRPGGAPRCFCPSP